MPRAAVCKGCEAYKQEIAFLRQELRESQDRMLAALSPQALAQLKGKPVATGAPQAVECWTDDQGKSWVTLGGKAVPLEDYQALVAKGGYIDNTGAFIPETEANAAMAKLTEMLGGGRA